MVGNGEVVGESRGRGRRSGGQGVYSRQTPAAASVGAPELNITVIYASRAHALAVGRDRREEGKREEGRGMEEGNGTGRERSGRAGMGG